MRSIILLSLGILLALNSFSQNSGKIIYQMIVGENEYELEETHLIFKGPESVFTLTDMEKKAIVHDGKMSAHEGDGFSLGLTFNMGPDRYIPYVYINRGTKVLEFEKYTLFQGEVINAIISEPIDLISWKIHDETKEIGRFECIKASASFRGREYTVWYTHEIPIALGPWKLIGLPGLILEAYDSEDDVKFLFRSVEIPYNGNVIPKPQAEGRRLTIEEFIEIERNASNEFIKILQAKLPRHTEITINEVRKENGKSMEREW
jgi:GLPGLI family protein